MCRSKSAARSERLRCVRGKGYRKGIETQLTIQIATRTGVKFVEPRYGPENPPGIHQFAQGLEFLRERGVAENGLFDLGREFEEIGEQTIEDAELFLEGRIAIFGESRGVGEKLGEALAVCGTLQNAKSIPSALRSRFNIYFHREAGAAFGKLRGEFDFTWLAIRFVLQNFLDGGWRQRRKMKLQAPGYDGGQESVGRRSREDERGRARRLLENFQENVGDIPAHGFRAIENKNAAPAHRLKVGGALDGAQLADAQHRTCDGALQADGIGRKRPNVRVRLQDQRYALDGGGVRAFAAFHEALLDQFLRIRELGDAQAGRTLVTEIIRHAFAVGGLGEHAREGKFADTAIPGKEQGMRDA